MVGTELLDWPLLDETWVSRDGVMVEALEGAWLAGDDVGPCEVD